MHAWLLLRELTSVIFLGYCTSTTVARTSLVAGEVLEWGTLVGTSVCDVQEMTAAGLTKVSNHSEL